MIKNFGSRKEIDIRLIWDAENFGSRDGLDLQDIKNVIYTYDYSIPSRFLDIIEINNNHEEMKSYDIEIIVRDDAYAIVDCVGYFIKDGILVIEIEDGSRRLIKDFIDVIIPKEWNDNEI